jgi:DNA-binding response OmpR family regulator
MRLVRGMVFILVITGFKMVMGRNIYIVEEDKAVQLRLSAGLQKKGFNVMVFDSGYPIVEMVDNWPDIFIIDIELPGINGMEICKWLKSHESSRHIPVIFLSGDPYLKILAESAQANDYIEKPAIFSQVINKINGCLIAEKIKPR